MALKIYPDASPDNPYSQDGLMSNPLRLGFNARLASTSEAKYYLRNDNSNFNYSDIQIQPVDHTGSHLVDGTNDFSWKLSAGDTQPTADEWDNITAGAAISMSDISDTSTYLPFWLKIEIPRGASVKSYRNVVLRIFGEETAA
jgi:hypothetical protein